ncbi:DUF2970 domain-containing protein [Shewanella gaetbuli]|uniref:DUF2970 domain-containing protein n=1 Tax=Shewanella gaetbuli TaxID=220752 RepID=A0A9X1ZJL4_9GAMM|nr:DUF2970 domain-containing protein [Shewanella gaetbuli]MCL1143549.1 DUF2970 domain-containing protein [Shewanella gaetbuli]
MSFWQVLTSTLAAFIGVQSDNNRQRDFKHTSPIPFILMGVLLAIALVLALILIVRQVVG